MSAPDGLRARRVGHRPLQAADAVQAVQDARSNEAFAPLPAPTGAPPYRLELAQILPAPEPTDRLVFHIIGDSGGIVDPAPQKAVAAALAADQPASGAAFLYSVGDVVYFNGDASQYYPQFYEPYDRYPAPIVAVPGNHDGDNSDNPAVPSLAAFVANFCAPTPALTQQAGDANRDAMTQPNVYWTLRAALVTIIGLYTNVPSGGVVEADQAAWFDSELAAAPTDRPVIVALHHPPYSADAHHGGSATMGALLDSAAQKAGRWPDLVVAGHVHDYQRFTRTVPAAAVRTTPPLTPEGIADSLGRQPLRQPMPPAIAALATGQQQIPYIVCGAGGYHNLHELAPDVGPLPWAAGPDVQLEAGVADRWGFLTVTIAAGRISGSYTAVDKTGAVTAHVDAF